ncbi:hypothetical protein, partial [Microcoleus sp. Pol7_B2]|uniref:hypothetical protein n=1 Tax=Microcoleus sp. Pol7_B2 TaxID=2818895 RepID=UPI002FCF9729
WGSETGFLTQIFGRMPKLSQKPGFLDGRASETGFLHPIGREDAKIIAETRFLGQRGCDF